VRYLIDGYNLLHALGLARKGGGRAAWDRARVQLLDWLADQLGDSASDATVAFDAQNAIGGIIEERYRGLRTVRDRGRSADDLIEDLLQSEREPSTLTVVSNDTRMRDAANHQGAIICRCQEFVDELLATRQRVATKPLRLPAEKDVLPTVEEQEAWLRAFGG
jgi:uncharacterized protein